MWTSRRQRYGTSSQTSPLENDPMSSPGITIRGGSLTTTILWAQIGEKSGVGGGGGGKRGVTNVCMYAALFRLYSGIITQTAHRAAGRAAAATGAAGKPFPILPVFALACAQSCYTTIQMG